MRLRGCVQHKPSLPVMNASYATQTDYTVQTVCTLYTNCIYDCGETVLSEMGSVSKKSTAQKIMVKYLQILGGDFASPHF